MPLQNMPHWHISCFELKLFKKEQVQLHLGAPSVFAEEQRKRRTRVPGLQRSGGWLAFQRVLVFCRGGHLDV